jgi:putative glutamine amidotransferase
VRTEGSLRELLGAEWVSTNSYHHQAVKKLGENLRAVAYSTEGYVEALEHTELPFFRAVQWHPELDPDEISRVLYEAFFREMK